MDRNGWKNSGYRGWKKGQFVIERITFDCYEISKGDEIVGARGDLAKAVARAEELMTTMDVMEDICRS